MPVAPTQVQGDADHGQDNDDVQMTDADNREYVFGAQNDNENDQPPPPQNAVALPSSSSSTTAPLQPAPIGHPLVDNSNANRAKQCFKCIETFYQEPVFIDHMLRFHGIKFTKPNDKNEPAPSDENEPTPNDENEPEPNGHNEPNEPGQFVRNPAKKRKSKTLAEDIAFDENANNRSAERKNKIRKTPFAPAN